MNINLSSIPKRFLSFLLDFFSILIIFFIINYVKYVLKGVNIQYVFENIDQLLVAYIGLFYFFVCFYWMGGQTIADRLIKIQTINVNKTNLNLFQSLLKSIFLSSFLFVFETRLVIIVYQFTLIVLSTVTLLNSPWRQKRQTIWDASTGTIVVNISKAVDGVDDLRKQRS